MIDCYIDTDKDHEVADGVWYYSSVSVWVEVPIEEAKRYFWKLKEINCKIKIKAHYFYLIHQTLIFPTSHNDNDAQNFPNYQDIEYFSEYSNEEEYVIIGGVKYHIIDIHPKKSKKPKSQEEIDKEDEEIRNDQRMNHF